MKDLDYIQRLRSFARQILPLVQDYIMNHSGEYQEFLREREEKRKAQEGKKPAMQNPAGNGVNSGGDGAA